MSRPEIYLSKVPSYKKFLISLKLLNKDKINKIYKNLFQHKCMKYYLILSKFKRVVFKNFKSK